MAEDNCNQVKGSSWWDTPPPTGFYTGSYGWISDTGVDTKYSRSSAALVDSAASVSSCPAVIFPEDHKQLHGASSTSTTASTMLDPGLQIMSLGLSSSTINDWNHSLLLGSKKPVEQVSFLSMLGPAGGMTTASTNFINHEAAAAAAAAAVEGASLFESQLVTSESLKQINLGTDPSHFMNPVLESSSSVYSSDYNLLQGLIIITDHHQHQPPHQQASSAFGSQTQQIDYTCYSTTDQDHDHQASYGFGLGPDDGINTNHHDLLPADDDDQFLIRSVPFPSPDQVPQPAPVLPSHQLRFTNTNNAPFWNASPAVPVAALSDAGRPNSFFHSVPSMFDQKPKNKSMEAARETTSKKNNTSSTDQDTNVKRPRNEASSTLPPFKVRKEKMGDRITALQQLVSPFGKTDTASVLSEAIEYIKFLHEQINVLSTPYLETRASLQHHENTYKFKDQDGPKQDLRSRGLCLVPVSSTFLVTQETTADFWTPTFGDAFCT